MGITEQVRDVVAPLCADADVDIWDVEWAGGSVRVLVDRVGGVGLDEIAALTRSFSRALDEADPVDTHYTLEVSSPGLERRLRTAEHFRRSVGATVQVKLHAEAAPDDERRLRGVVVAIDDSVADPVVVVEAADDAGATTHRIPLSQVERARTVFEWGPGPKPGSPSGSPKRKKAARS